MTNTIRKLLGFLLIASLLLAGMSALAETGSVTVNLKSDPTKGFNDPDGVEFELFMVAKASGTGSGWSATSGFSGLEIPKPEVKDGKSVYTDAQAKDVLAKVESILNTASNLSPLQTQTTKNGGKAVFTGLENGIYYIRKNPTSKTKLVKTSASLVTVTSADATVTIDAKYEYRRTTTTFTARKTWNDEDDFDEIQPSAVTVHLHRRLGEADDKTFDLEGTLSASNNWATTWRDLDDSDEDGVKYTYYVTEDNVTGYSATIDGGTVINSHIPDYGAIRVTKAVQVNGKATTDKLADGTYNFTITGPTESPRSKNYLNGERFSITVSDGKSNTWSRDKLKPGTYRIAEITSGLTNGMSVVGSAQQTIRVAAGTTAANPTDVTFTNNLVTGSLKLTKTVTVGGAPAGSTSVSGTYNFTVKGPSYPNGETVTIKIENGSSNSVQLDNLLLGEYEVTETKTGLSAGISYVSGDGKKTLGTSNTSANPLTFDFVNNLSLGSLKITKQVTVNSSSTTRTVADGTYRFTVKGPSYPDGETVSIKISKGKSNSVQLDNLIPGEYEVTEVKTGLPTGVSYVSGDGKKTLEVTHTATSPLTFTFVNNRTVTVPPSSSGSTPTPSSNTTTATPSPEPTPTPTPTPSPTPAVNINGEKIWRDESNTHGTRPDSIKVQLYRNGEQVREITVSGTNNRWSFSFGILPKVDENGAEYSYSVRETSVDGYTTTISGTSVINELVSQNPTTYTSISGTKTWSDDDNESGARPNYIVVKLLRDGVEVERRTVTAANGWQYSFQNIPVDDGYGNKYTYTISEEAVTDYVGRVKGYNLTNSKRPEKAEEEELTELGWYGTPLAGFGEPELEDLLELYDYGTPLWGRPLKTGDELPLYPIVFGGIGGCALIALVVLSALNKKRKRNAA